MSLKDKIVAVRKEFRTAIKNIPNDPSKLEEIRVKYLGRKGEVAKLFGNLGSILAEERAEFGKHLNELKIELQIEFDAASKKHQKRQNKSKVDSIDYTLPGIELPVGSNITLYGIGEANAVTGTIDVRIIEIKQ